MLKWIVLIVSLSGLHVNAQQCSKVLLSGIVKDTMRFQNFYNLMIVNETTGKGVFGLPNGQFELYVEPLDVIVFSIRDYQPVRITVNPSTECRDRRIVYLNPKPKELNEVVVRPLKSLEQIKEERSALALRETRTITGIEVIQSPITALYQAFSQKEKSKRIVAQKQYEDKQKAILQELLRLYVAYEIIELDEETFDDFIAFLNIDENFLKTASEMELITFIQDKFEHFVSLRKLGYQK